MKKDSYHEPVLVREIIGQLGARLNKTKIVDATLGTGGHTLALIKAGAEVLGIEVDPEMLKIAKKRLGIRAKLVQGNFKDIGEIARQNGFENVDAVLFDLGATNLQLTGEKRGFSFANPKAKLDMRLNSESQRVTAADLLNGLRPDHLEELFGQVLDYSASRWLAKRVVAERSLSPIVTVGDFLAVCAGLRSKPKLDPATLPFLALRLAVNCEQQNLKEALPKSLKLLKSGGKLLVICFHSKEREIVKSFSREFKGPIKPGEAEIRENPRSRSAALFVLEKGDENAEN